MTTIDAIIITAAVCFAAALLVSHFAGPAWRWLTAHKPRLVPQLQAIEAEASSVVSTVKKDFQAMTTSPVVEESKAKLGAIIADLKTRAQNAEKTLADRLADIEAANAKQGELDQANGHIADLTNENADLKAQLAAEQANHADDVNAISALASEAAG